MADFGRSARPVYGYREYNDKGDGAENCFVLDTEKYLYVSVVNYKDNQIAGKVALERLGLSPSSFSSVKELWSGDDVKDVYKRQAWYTLWLAELGCDVGPEWL